ncbi:MAG TPA: glucosyltransferase domain-containing protein [Kiritimatiellia bacterium]|nr:glucosyltransferase domain-containing protein [Kiritimatiellia bacterium]HRZ13598.1 glucosyltransferase domain-containing protein [Kiritimatiellia bacterium]HSA19306.1 glucosyltransferase domain-containing protein [Kiritimatiellia bacterium]
MPQDATQPTGETQDRDPAGSPDAGALGGRIRRAWERIPARFKKAFALAFGVNVLVFAYLLLQHPLGNHDISRLPWVEYRNQVSVGRWFCFFLYLLVGHAQLPVVNQLWAIVFHVSSGMAAAVYWRRAGGAYPLTVAALMASLVPFVLAYFYYSYQSLCFGAAQLLAIGGLIAAARATRSGVALGALLIMCALASYQPALNVAAVALMLRALLALSDSRARGETPAMGRFLRTTLGPGALALIAGGVLYRLSLALCRWLGLIEWNAYQLREASLGHLPSRLARSLEAAFAHLVIPQPYMLWPVKLILLALLVMAAWVALRRLGTGPGTRAQRIRYTAWGLLLLLGAIWATKSIFAVSPIRFYYAFRLAGGLTLLYLFGALLAMEAPSPRGRSLAAALAGAALLLFAHQDLVHSGLMVRSNQHDLQMANRILDRIETLPGLDADETYNLIVIGDLPRYAMQRYTERTRRFEEPADYMDEHSMVPPWEPELVFAMLGSSVSLQTPGRDRIQDVRRQQGYRYALQHAAWPAKDSVALLDGDLVVVVLEGDVAELAKGYAQLARRLRSVDDSDSARVAAVHADIEERLGQLYTRLEYRAGRKLGWIERQAAATQAGWEEAAADGAQPDPGIERLLQQVDEGIRSARARLDSTMAHTNASTAVRLETLQELCNEVLPPLQRALRHARESNRPALHDGG